MTKSDVVEVRKLELHDIELMRGVAAVALGLYPKVQADPADVIALCDLAIGALKADDWLPIESAPRDGTMVDLWCNGERLPNCIFSENQWMQQYAEAFSFFVIEGEITHYRRLPPAPKGEV